MTITKSEFEEAASNGITKAALYGRIRRGWDMERAVTEPLVSPEETIRRAAAKTPFHKTNQLHFARERFR